MHYIIYAETYTHKYLHTYLPMIHHCNSFPVFFQLGIVEMNELRYTLVYAYIHRLQRAYLHAYKQFKQHLYACMRMHTYIHTCIHTHTRIHTYMHSCIHDVCCGFAGVGLLVPAVLPESNPAGRYSIKSMQLLSASDREVTLDYRPVNIIMAVRYFHLCLNLQGGDEP